ncbi:MAG: sugar phosphate nucleotidyltransferase [Bacteroidota bacterium]
MAAGKGTRMKNPNMAKVMYEIGGKPMVDQVVSLSRKLKASRILLIVGWQRDSVVSYFSNQKDVEFVDQIEQLGTGHAVMQTTQKLEDFDGDVLVLSGDVPLLTIQILENLISLHRNDSATATILTAELENPKGYGRIIRNPDGKVVKIVEQKDANHEELKVTEINSGIYLFDKMKLFDALKHLKPNNAQGEYYLTDVFEYFWKNKWVVSAIKAPDPVEVIGINDLKQLEKARIIFDRKRS